MISFGLLIESSVVIFRIKFKKKKIKITIFHETKFTLVYESILYSTRQKQNKTRFALNGLLETVLKLNCYIIMAFRKTKRVISVQINSECNEKNKIPTSTYIPVIERYGNMDIYIEYLSHCSTGAI